MAQTIRNEASKNKVTYMNGKAPKDKAEDFIYLDLEIWNMLSILGQKETIKYLQDKIQTIKKMQGGGK